MRQVSSKGGVTIVGPGVAEITVTASETAGWMEGKKIVTVTVSALDEAEKAEEKAAIIEGIEKTTITSVKTTVLSNQVKLEWKKKTTGYDVDYYQVYRSTKKDSGYKKIYTLSYPNYNNFCEKIIIYSLYLSSTLPIGHGQGLGLPNGLI